ncbi:hypothetical protein ACFWFI_03830 [Streptomyces sp. NPDC060209]|uniref:hypothetical protein n=1 Tax=Streptomyces sp. NPDC060209 TaxID=3347073 RepID=UPI003648B2BA
MALQAEFTPDLRQWYSDHGQREYERGLDAAEKDEGVSVPHLGSVGGFPSGQRHSHI